MGWEHPQDLLGALLSSILSLSQASVSCSGDLLHDGDTWRDVSRHGGRSAGAKLPLAAMFLDGISKMLYSGRLGGPIAELATEPLMSLTPLGCKSNPYHS